jgi:hypothetical protein
MILPNQKFITSERSEQREHSRSDQNEDLAEDRFAHCPGQNKVGAEE